MFFKDNGDHIWVKPCKTYVYNLIMGVMDIHHTGEMTGKNFNNNVACSFILNDLGGWGKKNPSEANGKIVDESGNTLYTIKGDWKENPYISIISPSGQVVDTIFKKPNPANYESNYRFPVHTINANYISKDMLPYMCPTDCRMRPDTRALEYGEEDLAESEKKRLEEKQRAKKKQLEAANMHWEPKWFKAEYDIDSNEQVFRYRGGYWENKKKREWRGIDNLY